MRLLGLTLQSCVSGLLFPCRTLSQSLCRGRTHRLTREQHKRALDAPVALVVDAGLSTNGGGGRQCCVKSCLAATTLCPPGGQVWLSPCARKAALAFYLMSSCRVEQAGCRRSWLPLKQLVKTGTAA